MPSSVDCTTNTSEPEFSVHTAMCPRAEIPDSGETETGSTETRFDVALMRREAGSIRGFN
jgi:hypothetical protein